MGTQTFAHRADRLLSRLFPARLAPVEADERHAHSGAPHLWRMQRAFQIDFLQRMGLSPGHHLLDLGCGTLRGGLPLIGYLATGNYTGIDVREEIVDEARRELEAAGLVGRYPRLSHVASLEKLELNAGYDYIWAFGVWMHLEDPVLEHAFEFVSRHLEPQGQCFGNVHLGDGQLGTWNGFPVLARPLDWYEERAAQFGLELDSLGRLQQLGHVSGDRSHDTQCMLRIRLPR